MALSLYPCAPYVPIDDGDVIEAAGGDFAVPGASHVELDFDYGDGGTEFTGSYTGSEVDPDDILEEAGGNYVPAPRAKVLDDTWYGPGSAWQGQLVWPTSSGEDSEFDDEFEDRGMTALLAALGEPVTHVASDGSETVVVAMCTRLADAERGERDGKSKRWRAEFVIEEGIVTVALNDGIVWNGVTYTVLEVHQGTHVIGEAYGSVEKSRRDYRTAR